MTRNSQESERSGIFSSPYESPTSTGQGQSVSRLAPRNEAFLEAAKALKPLPGEPFTVYLERLKAEAERLSAPRTPYREPGSDDE